MPKWKKPAPYAENEILSGKGFYISFNPGPSINFTGSSVPETALKGENGPWLILSGDFRKDYEKAAPKGYEACVKVYEKNKQHRNGHSTD